MELDKRTNIEYDNHQWNKNERLYLNNSYQSKPKGYSNNEKSDDILDKHNNIASPSEGKNSVVVFEHIVPNSVKKMWVMAESAQHINTNKDKKSNKTFDSGRKLSTKYGNFFISHDAAKEDLQNNDEVVKKLRSDRISESTELNHAKNHWGVDLKPVSNQSSQDISKREIHSDSNRYKNLLSDDCSLLKNSSSQINSSSRSYSLDSLDEIDDKEKEYPTKLSVMQRLKSFEKPSLDEENHQNNKYAYLHTKRPLKPSIGNVDLRGNSKIFYQPTSKNSNTKILNQTSHTESKSKRSPISLKDLLKQDEESLTVDVVNKNMKNADNSNNKAKIQTSQTKIHQTNGIDNFADIIENKEKTNQTNLIATESDLSTTNNNDLSMFLKTKNSILTEKVDLSVLNSINENSSTSEKTEREKNVAIESQSKTVIHESSKSIESLPLMENVAVENKSKAAIDETSKSLKSLSSTKIGDNLFIGNDKKLSETLQQTADKTIPDEKQIQYNKLGQVILRKVDVEIPESVPEKSNTITYQKQKEDIEDSYIIINSENKHDVLETEKEENQKSNRVIGYVETSKPNELSDDVESLRDYTQKNVDKVSKRIEDFDISKEKPPDKQNNIDTVVNLSNSQTQLSSDILKPTESLQSIQNDGSRRVGKLIIMSGQERDEQLKELEKVKNGGSPSDKVFGVHLLFLSNEVAGDNEPLPPVPEILFNEPLPQLKSIMTHGKVKKLKKISVNFKTGKLTTVHTYPSERSYLDDVDGSGEFVEVEDAVHRERERMSHEEDTPKVETMENINFVTDGEDFNSFSTQESGSALLF